MGNREQDIKRRKTKVIKIGNVFIGGEYPITVQSMTNTPTKDIKKTVNQIKKLTKAGAEIVRVAVPDIESANVIGEIKKNISIPLIADIHFDYNLALIALNQGVDGLRLNPGNIKNKENLKKVVKEAKIREVPIRIGINLGSIPYQILKKYEFNYAKCLSDFALENIKMLEELNFYLIKVSVKANNVLTTVKAYKELATKCDYPFHIGITEAGLEFSGTIKSVAGISILLYEGIGDTIRVSLTDDPIKEVKVGWEILKVLNLREQGPKIVSCPTCARTSINLIKLTKEVEKRLKKYNKSITVAVMGCVVNGPGEARMADIGIAGDKDGGIIFKKGKVLGFFKENELIDILFSHIDNIIDN